MFTFYKSSKVQSDILHLANPETFDSALQYTKVKLSIIGSQPIEIAIKSINQQRIVVRQLQTIEHLHLQINLPQQTTSEEVINLYVQFLFEDFIPKFKESIQHLSIADSSFNYFVVGDSSKDLIEDFFIKLLSPMQNLKTFQLIEKLPSKQLADDNILIRIRKILQSKIVILPNLEFVDIDSSFTFKDQNVKKVCNKLFDNLIQVSDTFGALESIRNIQFCLQDINLDSNFINKFSSSLGKFQNLKRLGLDFSQNDYIKSEDATQCLKNLENLKTTLEEFIFIENSPYSKNSAQKFCQQLKEFKNLVYLQLEGLPFKGVAVEEFFNIFNSLENLQTLIICLEYFDLKSHLEKSMKIFGSSLKNLKNLDITFPSILIKEQDMTSICLAVEGYKQTLEHLNITFTNKIDDASGLKLVETICSLSKLKELIIVLKSKGTFSTDLNLDCQRNQEATNIFECKRINFKNRIWTDHFYLLLLLLFSFIRKLKYPIEQFKADFIPNNQKQFISPIIKDKIKEQFEGLLKQTSLQVFKWNFLQNVEFLDFKQIIMNNINSLTIMKVKTPSDEIMDVILQCKNLQILTITFFSQKIEIERVLMNLKLLSSLSYSNLGYPNWNNPIHPNIYLQSQYLTRLNLDNINEVYTLLHSNNYISYELTSQRISAIYTLIVYHKLISPELLYSPIQSYWDLLF